MFNLHTLNFEDYEIEGYDDWIDEYGEFHCGCGCYEGDGGVYQFDINKFHQLHADAFQALIEALQSRTRQVTL